MAEQGWKFSKRGAGCAQCGRPFAVGEEVVSALFDVLAAGRDLPSETGAAEAPVEPSKNAAGTTEADDQKKSRENAGFSRRDFCPDCFKTLPTETVFSFWKSFAADPEARKERTCAPRIAWEDVLEFFRRLAGETDPQRRAFRYALALMLSRRKILRLDGSRRKKNESGGEEDLLLFIERAPGRGGWAAGERHEVVQPTLDESALGAISGELGRLLGFPEPKNETDEKKPEEQTETVAGASEESDAPVAAETVPTETAVNTEAKPT